MRALAMDLWWTWNPDAQRLFASLDPGLWEATHHNPIGTLERLSPERRGAVESDPLFADHLARVESDLKEYLSAPTWFARTMRGRARKMLVAYFCAEYAVHESLPQYSGGLGVLAGDHLKSASDLGVPLVGIGLLYRCGFYTQQLNPDGSTRVIYPTLDLRSFRFETRAGRLMCRWAGAAFAPRSGFSLWGARTCTCSTRISRRTHRGIARSPATCTAAIANIAFSRKSCSASAG
jgi:glucan phosphorylase